MVKYGFELSARKNLRPKVFETESQKGEKKEEKIITFLFVDKFYLNSLQVLIFVA